MAQVTPAKPSPPKGKGLNGKIGPVPVKVAVFVVALIVAYFLYRNFSKKTATSAGTSSAPTSAGGLGRVADNLGGGASGQGATQGGTTLGGDATTTPEANRISPIIYQEPGGSPGPVRDGGGSPGSSPPDNGRPPPIPPIQPPRDGVRPAATDPASYYGFDLSSLGQPGVKLPSFGGNTSRPVTALSPSMPDSSFGGSRPDLPGFAQDPNRGVVQAADVVLANQTLVPPSGYVKPGGVPGPTR